MDARTNNPRIVPLLIERWSPRAFDGTALPKDDLDVILEAAGLAPSAMNYQPWRFLYALRGDANWDLFLSLLVPANASWATNAGALLFVVSDTQLRRHDSASFNHSHSFDAGAAWVQLALQATAMGYHAHGMGGIDHARIREELAIPEDFRIEAGIAIGRRAPADTLPEALRAREVPSARKPITAIAAPGGFGNLPRE